MTVRIYAADGEPFDVPASREAHLLLNKGFSRAPHDPYAVPLVQDVPGHREKMAQAQAEWDALMAERDYEASQEIDFSGLLAGDDAEDEPEPAPVLRRRRRAKPA